MDKLGHAQQAVHIINHEKHNATTSPQFRKKNVPKITDIHKLSVCQLMHKLFNNTKSEVLRGIFAQSQDVHYCHTREQRCF